MDIQTSDIHDIACTLLACWTLDSFQLPTCPITGKTGKGKGKPQQRAKKILKNKKIKKFEYKCHSFPHYFVFKNLLIRIT